MFLLYSLVVSLMDLVPRIAYSTLECTPTVPCSFLSRFIYPEFLVPTGPQNLVPFILLCRIPTNFHLCAFFSALCSLVCSSFVSFFPSRVLKLWIWLLRGDVWRWLYRQMHRKISTHVAGGPSGGSNMCRPGSEDPHRRERKFVNCSFNLLPLLPKF